jgi:hypothetical protein
VQVVDSDEGFYRHQEFPIDNPSINETCPADATGLDGGYPFPGVEKAPDSLPGLPKYEAYDGPSVPLKSNYLITGRDFNATMYILWQPYTAKGETLPTIPVPVGYQKWTFQATTTQNTPVTQEILNANQFHKGVITKSGAVGSFQLSTWASSGLHGYPMWSQLSDPGETCVEEVQ